MATIFRQLAEFENGLVVVRLEFDDATLRVLGVRVINNGGSNVFVAVVRNKDNELYSTVFPPGETFVSFPTTGSRRLTLENIERKLWGISISMSYPA